MTEPKKRTRQPRPKQVNYEDMSIKEILKRRQEAEDVLNKIDAVLNKVGQVSRPNSFNVPSGGVVNTAAGMVDYARAQQSIAGNRVMPNYPANYYPLNASLADEGDVQSYDDAVVSILPPEQSELDVNSPDFIGLSEGGIPIHPKRENIVNPQVTTEDERQQLLDEINKYF